MCWDSSSSSIFQSTLSVRRATSTNWEEADASKFQSTLSVRRATNQVAEALLGAGKFQSTLSVRRATSLMSAGGTHITISIPALRKESDPSPARYAVCESAISIHALRKESDPLEVFHAAAGELISIHALRKESDRPSTAPSRASRYFNPRSP